MIITMFGFFCSDMGVHSPGVRCAGLATDATLLSRTEGAAHCQYESTSPLVNASAASVGGGINAKVALSVHNPRLLAGSTLFVDVARTEQDQCTHDQHPGGECQCQPHGDIARDEQSERHE